MRQHHVGDVILVEDRDDRRFPIGILTDRDLVIEVLDSGVDTDRLVLGDLVTELLLTAREHDGVPETLKRMRERGVRRVPVVDNDGALVGVLSVEDVVELMAEEVADLSRLAVRERAHERDTRSAPKADRDSAS